MVNPRKSKIIYFSNTRSLIAKVVESEEEIEWIDPLPEPTAPEPEPKSSVIARARQWLLALLAN